MVLAFADVRLDPKAREVWRGTRSLRLTRTEFAILEVLMRRSPAVVDRMSIALHAWRDESDAIGSNTIDVHVGHLRKKLEHGETIIKTIRGVGYQFCRTPEDARAE